MKVLWVHNYNRKSPLSGVNMRELIDPLKAAGIEVVPYDMGMCSRDLLFNRSVLKNLSQVAKDFDIIHAQYGSACGWMVSKLNHPKKILSLKGSDLDGNKVCWSRRKFLGSVARVLTLRSLKRYNHIIVMSERMRRDIMRRSGKVPVSVLADGMDVSRFGKLSRNDARAMLGADAGELWVLFVCVFTDDVVKRYSLARAAVQQLQQTLPRARLITLTEISRDLVPAYFSAADVVLLTSFHEGWPNAIKECLASNRPFVATDVSDLRQVAAQTATCKITADNPDAIAGALHEVLTSPRKDDNLRPLAQGFDYQYYVPHLVGLYHSILND